MRILRLKADVPLQTAGVYYHCVSRIVDRAFVLGEEEKNHLVELMREYERFCGVHVLTYCMMSDHFHLLLEVPAPPQETLGDQELIAKVRKLPGQNHAEQLEDELAQLRRRGQTEAAEALKQRVRWRMFNVSSFIKPLKQRFTQWYNPAHGRWGTLWDQRFKSVMIEGSGTAMAVVAAYVDLNPVRAGLVEDPRDYRWCGYGEALSGGTKAEAGLRRIMALASGESVTFKEALTKYQAWLFGPNAQKEDTAAKGRLVRRGMTEAEVEELVKDKGRLPWAEYLRLRVRYFTDGVALGSRDFVNNVFSTHRDRFGPNRKDGARQLRYVDSDELFSLRALRVRAFGK